MYSLNSRQAEGLAGFFFDIAKGLVLGGVGISVFSSPGVRIATILAEASFAIICVFFALNLLKGGR